MTPEYSAPASLDRTLTRLARAARERVSVVAIEKVITQLKCRYDCPDDCVRCAESLHFMYLPMDE